LYIKEIVYHLLVYQSIISKKNVYNNVYNKYGTFYVIGYRVIFLSK
jgi:hypothetical protein